MASTDASPIKLGHRMPSRVPPARISILFLLGVLGAAWVGRSVALAGPQKALVLSLAAAGLPIGWSLAKRRVGTGLLVVEAPLLLLLVSTLEFRARATADLAFNPLDPAAQFRVACVLLALLLGLIALTARPHEEVGQSRAKVITTPMRFVVAYAAVVFAGAFFSVKPFLTVYRGIELVTLVVVVIGAFRHAGHRATPRIGAVIYWFVVALVASVWVGVIFWPGQAITHFQNRAVPIQWQINGVRPGISANNVGFLGVLLVMWSLALGTPGSAGWLRLRPWVRRAMVPLGLITLLSAQYRTGYAALILAGTAYLILTRRWPLAGLLLACVTAVVVWYPSTVRTAEPYVLRGTVQQASHLSSRLSWWSAALPVWRESPWVGRGLLTATRFEVLDELGLPFTSTIHSTWVESLVGAGIIGVALLAGAVLTALARAARRALREPPDILPILLLLILVVRSTTSSELSSMTLGMAVLLWLSMSMTERKEHSAAASRVGVAVA